MSSYQQEESFGRAGKSLLVIGIAVIVIFLKSIIRYFIRSVVNGEAEQQRIIHEVIGPTSILGDSILPIAGLIALVVGAIAALVLAWNLLAGIWHGSVAGAARSGLPIGKIVFGIVFVAVIGGGGYFWYQQNRVAEPKIGLGADKVESTVDAANEGREIFYYLHEKYTRLLRPGVKYRFESNAYDSVLIRLESGESYDVAYGENVYESSFHPRRMNPEKLVREPIFWLRAQRGAEVECIAYRLGVFRLFEEPIQDECEENVRFPIGLVKKDPHMTYRISAMTGTVLWSEKSYRKWRDVERWAKPLTSEYFDNTCDSVYLYTKTATKLLFERFVLDETANQEASRAYYATEIHRRQQERIAARKQKRNSGEEARKQAEAQRREERRRQEASIQEPSKTDSGNDVNLGLGRFLFTIVIVGLVLGVFYFVIKTRPNSAVYKWFYGLKKRL